MCRPVCLNSYCNLQAHCSTGACHPCVMHNTLLPCLTARSNEEDQLLVGSVLDLQVGQGGRKKGRLVPNRLRYATRHVAYPNPHL
jgi:hypothetical protein